MTLRERELEWQRRRRFPAWDRMGGPSSASRWAYRHPVGTVALLALLFGVPVMGLSLTGRGAGLELPFLAVAGVLGTAWQLRVAGELFEEWREQGGDDRAAEARKVGWLERSDHYQQIQAEQENEFGVEDAMSPANERFFTIWMAYIGLGVGVALLAALIGALTR